MTVVPRIKWVLLGFILVLLFETSIALNIAVIGAGASGLASAKNALEQGHKVVIFEKGPRLGGIWWYTNRVGKDEYGVEIHTPMYQGLRTNTPCETMEFPGIQFSNRTTKYPTSDVVWNYLNSYAKKFNVTKHIKYHHLVEKVHPIKNKRWKITVKDLPNKRTNTNTYDAVFVCTGVCSSPRFPNYNGTFNGYTLHSHDYRSPEHFEGKDVLVVGDGVSGTDIANKLLTTARTVTLSARGRLPLDNNSMEWSDDEEDGDEIIRKCDVKCLTADGAEFVDGTHCNFSVIIYATGYLYAYPFLNESSSIHTENNYVRPLYKQIINIEHPTMAFIGIPSGGMHNVMVDLQARFALKFLSGDKKLPTKDEMTMDTWTQIQNRMTENYPLNRFHALKMGRDEYYTDLADTADIQHIPESVFSYTW
ncbi:dimethylaniline monooxygenase [N-oxide-forming] 3-like [Contarinia nasturtii]|uniref:dimethylaniline monooxygenase [N-oxide-forming] 3-like n=1 Tax=Contarinia nasturtii TaxID=265458 RepID=UPI0012D3D8E1|nr:dimethylaniline monooxygenase [N-oxide-forming] 3-like [Contarinia nasturtii]